MLGIAIQKLQNQTDVIIYEFHTRVTKCYDFKALNSMGACGTRPIKGFVL